MALTQTGPLTKDTDDIALGLAQIRVGNSATNIAQTNSVLTSGESIGALATTRLVLEREYFTHEAGFPLLEDVQIPIRERASLECAFEEISAANMILSAGKDPNTETELKLGTLENPVYVRMEAIYTYPNGTDQMIIIFPRAQVLSNTELEFQKEENANVPITFKAQRADSGVEGGNSAWDNMPLGRIYWTSS